MPQCVGTMPTYALHTTLLPWQMNSTFIIVLSLLDLSRNALFCRKTLDSYSSPVSDNTTLNRACNLLQKKINKISQFQNNTTDFLQFTPLIISRLQLRIFRRISFCFVYRILCFILFHLHIHDFICIKFQFIKKIL